MDTLIPTAGLRPIDLSDLPFAGELPDQDAVLWAAACEATDNKLADYIEHPAAGPCVVCGKTRGTRVHMPHPGRPRETFDVADTSRNTTAHELADAYFLKKSADQLERKRPRVYCANCLAVSEENRSAKRKERAADLFFGGMPIDEVAATVGLGVESIRKILAAEKRSRDYLSRVFADILDGFGATQAQAARLVGVNVSTLKRWKDDDGSSTGDLGELELAPVDWFVVGDSGFKQATVSISRRAA